MSGYLIPTKSGQKGPFTVEQIQQLVDQGKIPLNFNVIEADSGFSVEVADLLPEPEEVIEIPDEYPEEDEYSEEEEYYEEEPEYEEPVARPAAPQRRRGGAPRSGARAGRGAPRGSGRAPARGRGGDRFSGGGYQPKKNNTPIVMIAILLVLVGGGGGWWWYTQADRGVVGTWKFDADGTLAGMASKLDAELAKEGIKPDTPEYEAATGIMKASMAMFEAMTLTLEENGDCSTEVELMGQKKVEKSTYTATSLGGGEYDLVFKSDKDHTVRVQGNTMTMTRKKGTTGALPFGWDQFTVVLKRQ